MGQKEKLIKRLKTKPRDFTFDEAETLLGYLTYSRSNKGKTSGSRVMFTSEQHAPILLHKPHPVSYTHLARRPFLVCLDEASRFPSWKRIHSSRSARARPPMRSTSLFSPRRALLFNPPSKPPRLTRSSQWQKRVLASASCRRRSSVRLTMYAALSCKSPSRCVPCAS